MNRTMRMNVIKRDGKSEPVSFDKIMTRIGRLCWAENGKPNHSGRIQNGLSVDISRIVASVCSSIIDNITTVQLDNLTADKAASMVTNHPDYGILAARIEVSNLHKQTSDSVVETYEQLSELLSDEFLEIVREHKDEFQSFVDYNRDYTFDYFGFSTMKRMYLTKLGNKIVERPQHTYLRVAIALWKDDTKRVKETYDALSTRKFTHASPTLFNAGFKKSNLASCFVKGTRVPTGTRGIVNIEDVVIGDTVVTHTGKIKKVSQLHANAIGSRTLYDLKLYGTPTIGVTGNHRFLAQKMSERHVSLGNVEWYPVEELSVGDYIAISTKNDGYDCNVIDAYPSVIEGVQAGLAGRGQLEYSVEATENKVSIITKNGYRQGKFNGSPFVLNKACAPVSRFWKLDDAFAWFMGVWFGDGCVNHRTSNSGVRSASNVSIVSHPDNVQLIERIVNTGQSIFGIKPVVRVHKNQKLATVIFHSKTMAVAFEQLFGCGYLLKRVNPRFMSESKSFVENFIAGLISSDGCVSKKLQVAIQISNKELAESVFIMSRQAGIVSSLAKVSKPESWNYSDTYRVGFTTITPNVVRNITKHYDDNRMSRLLSKSSNKHFCKNVEIDGKPFIRIESISPSSARTDVVYTLGVEDDHSYSVEGVVCENCFLVKVEDSLSDIFKSLGDVAQLSKYGGGIGLHLSDVRGRGSKILGTNGESDGIIPMLKVFDATSAYANQGGRRKGSFAVYLEPHHPDIMDFLLLRRNQGEESLRARNLFYAMWLNDLFMKRVETDSAWSLFDPHECPGLTDAFGKEYEELYIRYESEGKAKKILKARDVWNAMVVTQIETGMPYVLNKDSVNVKNMQANAGTIKGSNLCAEIVEYTSKEEAAVCVIGSIVLQNYINNDRYDFEDLRKHVKILAKNLDRSIDVMSYAIPEAEISNKHRRPIGIGVQGLQDVFFKLKMPFDSEKARELNREIFEHIYFAAVEASCELADEYGPHPTFEGSPASRGIMQYHLWDSKPKTNLDWQGLEERIKKGVRNSLTTALMPTASTAQICGSVEAMEPITSNIYSRRTLAGEFPVVNSYLVRDLISRGIWSENLKNQIIANGGSIQRVVGIYPDLKAIYKTAWELSMKSVIDMAADRAPFIDQTQSMNLFVASPSLKTVTSMLFYGWKKGLKTIMYYLRSKPSANAVAVTIDQCLVCSA